MIVRARAESFGAWVALAEPDALVAVDRERARALGVDGAEAWREGAPSRAPRPLETHVAVTARCGAGCEGCYLDARPDGVEPPREEIEARLRAVAESGAFTVAFGGGEPLSRRDLGELARYARALGLVPVMTTSGAGLAAARADELRAFAQVNVSHDGVGEAYAAVRGHVGAEGAERAIATLVAAGVRVGVNLVLTRASFDAVEATAARVEALGAGELQLLRYKPGGRAASLLYLERRLAPEQVARLPGLVEDVVKARRLRVRIDCAMVPYFVETASGAADVERLEAFGVFGCEAGRHLSALRVDGRVAPCSFAASDGEDAAPSDGGVEGLRAWHASLPAPCDTCALRAVCRGGCQIVSRHLVDGAFAPDPECPRVRAFDAGEVTRSA